jgi:hypothetical protein
MAVQFVMGALVCVQVCADAGMRLLNKLLPTAAINSGMARSFIS